jgi:serine/threonine-protein kinase
VNSVGNQRFRFERRLSARTDAAVWLARDVTTDELVAVKQLSKRGSADPTTRRRFARGIRLARRLNHRHIVKILDADPTGPRPYLVEEYVPGEPLDHILRRGHLPPATAIRITGALARALGHIHGRGVVHGDVKPGNILIRNDGEVKLSDFDIARDLATPADANVFGSIHYMSPERVAGAPVTPSDDIYGLGVTFYEMVSGLRPFTGASPLEVAMAHRRGTVVPIRSVRDLSPAASAILSGMIATSAEDRYSNAGYVAMSLDAVLAHDRLAQNRLERLARTTHDQVAV